MPLKSNLFPLLATCFLLLVSCSIQKQISTSAEQLVIKDSSLLTAHVGISIYDPDANKYLYNYQGDKYFIPASNTKIPTCYAAMKYLGDSLVGARILEYRNDLIILPAGDPSFLNEEFKFQPLLSLMKEKGNSIIVRYGAWQDYRWGNGWSWNDYQETYMAERYALPMYGNNVKNFNTDDSAMSVFGSTDSAVYTTFPKVFSKREYWGKSKYNLSEISKEFSAQEIKLRVEKGEKISFSAGRTIEKNEFYVKPSLKLQKIQSIPFVTSSIIANELLRDTLKKKVINENIYFTGDEKISKSSFKIIHSQPTDSLLKPMIQRSDNFFAEQTLLMVSNELLGVMNDERIIDTLLKTDFKDLPQKPRWVDGSGLSRYNLFTPQDFVAILNKMKNEFPMERIKEILPTGGEGTLSGNYKTDRNYTVYK